MSDGVTDSRPDNWPTARPESLADEVLAFKQLEGMNIVRIHKLDWDSVEFWVRDPLKEGFQFTQVWRIERVLAGKMQLVRVGAPTRD